jgi:L-Ala-D/L-Glu epimerase
MRITAIETYPVRLPLKPERRMISALGKHDVSNFVLVRIRTDAGIEGVGEATVTPNWSGETPESAQALIQHYLAPVLIGCDPRDIAEIDRRMTVVSFYNWFAKAAVEMACWDIAGRAVGKPVYDLLGGPCRPLTIRNRFSIGAYAPEVAAQRAIERVAVGFDTIKVKTGTDPAVDVARVRAVHKAIGPNIALMIDANGGWTLDQAIWSLQQLSDIELTLVEQPLQRGDYRGLKELKAKTGCKILADESCFDEIEARELLEQQACDVLSLYPGKNGGIARMQRIAALAAEYHVPCSIGSNLEWDVGAAAMLHAIIASPNMQVDRYPGDCLGPFYHEVSIAKTPLTITGPFSSLSTRPGLGIDVAWDVVEQHRMPPR